jgi:hypothetical protein
MQYGYPPDLAKLEADRVLEQSELLAEELTGADQFHLLTYYFSIHYGTNNTNIIVIPP